MIPNIEIREKFIKLSDANPPAFDKNHKKF